MATIHIPLVDSPYLQDVSELQNGVGPILVVEPSDYTKMETLTDYVAANNIKEVRFMPGDYRFWSANSPTNSNRFRGVVGSGIDDRIIFRYWDPELPDPYNPPHPVDRVGTDKEAIFLDMQIGPSIGAFECRYVILAGLTFRGDAVDQASGPNMFHARDIIIHECLVEDFWSAGTNIFWDNNWIQRCVIRNSLANLEGAVDTWGLMTSCINGRSITGGGYVDNEVYGVVDCVGQDISSGGDIYYYSGQVGGLICDGNDFYAPAEFTLFENGIDLKTGNQDNVNTYSNNRMWGFRDGTGGTGGSGFVIVCHRTQINAVFEDNIIGDCDSAFWEKVYIDDPTDFVAFTADNTDDSFTTIVPSSRTGIDTGFGPIRLFTDDTLPAGVSTGTDYWIIKVDDYTFRVATTLSGAQANSYVSISDNGTGEHYFSDTGAITLAERHYDRNNHLLNNVLYDVTNVFRPDVDATISGNIIIRSETLFAEASDSPRQNTITAIDNQLHKVDAIYVDDEDNPAAPYNEEDNSIWIPVTYTYERRRFTGPETVSILGFIHARNHYNGIPRDKKYFRMLVGEDDNYYADNETKIPAKLRGTATLTGGSVTVSNDLITEDSFAFVSPQHPYPTSSGIIWGIGDGYITISGAEDQNYLVSYTVTIPSPS